MVHIDVHGGSEFGGRFLACIHDLLHLGLDLGLGVRADLTGKGDFIRNDVGAAPPSMRPILEVVSGSMRPNFTLLMARAAALMALMPFSGSMPPWADFPWKVMVSTSFPAPDFKIKPRFPAPSREKMFLVGILE